MRDINFFSKYQSKFEVNNDIIKHLNRALAVFFIFVVLNVSINFIRIFWASYQIKSYTEKLNEPTLSSQIAEANKIATEIEVLTQYEAKVKDIANSINAKDNVSYDLLIQLSSVVPSEISYKSLEIESNQVVIQGNATKNDAVAELLHNLKELDNVLSVHVDSIDSKDSVEGEYSFQIKCVLKDVL